MRGVLKSWYSRLTIFLFTLFLSFTPAVVLAIGNTQGSCQTGEIETGLGCITENPSSGSALISFIKFAYQAALFLGSTLAVIMVILGGIQYITSSGNPDQIQTAKDRIFSALLGLGLLIVAAVLFRTIGVGEGIFQ